MPVRLVDLARTAQTSCVSRRDLGSHLPSQGLSWLWAEVSEPPLPVSHSLQVRAIVSCGPALLSCRALESGSLLWPSSPGARVGVVFLLSSLPVYFWVGRLRHRSK